MAKFLATHGISYLLEGMMMDAKEHLTLCFPRLYFTSAFWVRLIDAYERGVKIRMVFASDELDVYQRDSINHWSEMELYYCPNLNARCYFNEKLMLQTSMDIQEFDEKPNRDMGILIDSDVDQLLFRQAQLEIASLINSSQRIELFHPEQELLVLSED